MQLSGDRREDVPRHGDETQKVVRDDTAFRGNTTLTIAQQSLTETPIQRMHRKPLADQELCPHRLGAGAHQHVAHTDSDHFGRVGRSAGEVVKRINSWQAIFLTSPTSSGSYPLMDIERRLPGFQRRHVCACRPRFDVSPGRAAAAGSYTTRRQTVSIEKGPSQNPQIRTLSVRLEPCIAKGIRKMARFDVPAAEAKIAEGLKTVHEQREVVVDACMRAEQMVADGNLAEGGGRSVTV